MKDENGLSFASREVDIGVVWSSDVVAGEAVGGSWWSPHALGSDFACLPLFVPGGSLAATFSAILSLSCRMLCFRHVSLSSRTALSAIARAARPATRALPCASLSLTAARGLHSLPQLDYAYDVRPSPALPRLPRLPANAPSLRRSSSRTSWPRSWSST